MEGYMPKKFLIVVAGGGYTNAAPLLEIGKILHSRGHITEFGTLANRSHWLTSHPHISTTHILGPAIAPSVEEAAYLSMSTWNASLWRNWACVFSTKQFLESTWLAVYTSLSAIMRDPQTRPDFIIADYLVDAVRDMAVEYDVPIAMHWPQMPTAMLPAPYIPGTAGLQVGILSSEFATIWQRLKSEMVIYTSLWHYLRYRRWLKNLRASVGARMLPVLRKPEYLCLVNSFFGVEVPKDLPPNVVAIGPVLADEVLPLEEPYASFLAGHQRVVYVALGTHVLLRHGHLYAIIKGLVAAMADGAIDGVIWSLSLTARKQLDPSCGIALSAVNPDTPHTRISITTILENGYPDIHVTPFAPQRSILAHKSIRLYLTHGGAASTNEAVFAGVPTITLGVYFDQIQNSMRLRDAGVSISLNKETLNAEDVRKVVGRVMSGDGEEGREEREERVNEAASIRVNCERLKKIARIAARRKFLAADLVEEVLVDWEARRIERELGGKKGLNRRRKVRGMHLQPADQRMGWFKAQNLDLWAIVGGALALVLGISVLLPAITARHF